MKKCLSARANKVAPDFEFFSASHHLQGKVLSCTSRHSLHDSPGELCIWSSVWRSRRSVLQQRPEASWVAIQSAQLFPQPLWLGTRYSRLSAGPLALHVGLIKPWLLEMFWDRRVPPSSMCVWCPCSLHLSPSTPWCKSNHWTESLWRAGPRT